MLSINTNIASIDTANYLSTNNDALDTAMKQLSSGKRINSAADDAAGLAISTRMTSLINGYNVSVRNANDGVSLLQTAEANAGSVSDILQRIRELAVQADNGTYGTTDKASLQQEVSQLLQEIDHIRNVTSFNGIQLLNNPAQVLSLHISPLATDTVTIQLTDVGLTALGINGISVTLNAQAAISQVDAAINSIAATRAAFGAFENRLSFTISNLNTTNEQTQSAQSRIQDADMASAVSQMTKDKILTQSAISMLTQANQNPQMLLDLLK